MNRLTANLIMLTAAALWGMGFVAQSTAMEEIGPFMFTGLRFFGATLLLLPLALWERGRPGAQPVRLWPMVLIGTFLFLAIVTQQVGLVTTSVTNSGFLTAIYVVLVPVVAYLLFGERPMPVIVPGGLLAMVGLYFLTGAAITKLQPGDSLTLVCALFWALQVTLVARFMAGINRPFTLAFTQFAITSALGICIGLVVETTTFDAIRAATTEILYAGLISGGVAFTLQVVAQRHTSAAQAALILSMESVFAASFGALFLGERLAPAAYGGAVLILLAILLVELYPDWVRRRLRA